MKHEILIFHIDVLKGVRMKKDGFTMIELVFVIVILGILAAVAVPKLAATREDAKDARACANSATCVSDIISQYTATGNASTDHKSCTDAIDYGVNIIADLVDHSVNVTNTPRLCVDFSREYEFGGSRISP